MNTGRFQRPRQKAAAALAACVVLLLGGALLAEDYEDPIDPGPNSTPGTVFGDKVIAPSDVTGFSIDAKDAIEPQLTALLTMEEIEDSPSEKVVVTTQPMFSWTVQESLAGS